MIRLLQIELAKLWPAKYFRILVVLWLTAFISIPFGGVRLLEWMTNGMAFAENIMLDPNAWPIFDHGDLWQNLSYVYKMFTVFLSFVVIISVTNEFDYKTIRQNVIDGFSKKEFWLSKISLILFFSILATAMLFVLGVILNWTYSVSFDATLLATNSEFLFAYFFQLVYFLMFCFVLSLWIKRAGVVIATMVFWVYIIEPILSALVVDRWLDMPVLAQSLPMEAGWNLIQFPFTKYLLMQTQDFIGAQDILVASGWMAFFFLVSYLLITKRDL